MEPININEKYTGIDLLIAQKCDDGNGILEEEKNEISIFTKAQQDFQASGEKQEVTIKGVRYYFNKAVNALLKVPEQVDRPHTEVPDATAVASNIKTEPVAGSENTTEKEFELLPRLSQTTQIKFPEQDIDEELLNQAFDNVINDLLKKGGKKKSAIMGMGSTYLNYAKERNINPFVLMGVSMIESSYGTSDWAIKKNNVCGVHAKCATVADSIRIGSDVLQKNVYNKNLQTIHSIGTRGNYCAADSATRARWVKNTTFFANKVMDEYNRLLKERQNNKFKETIEN